MYPLSVSEWDDSLSEVVATMNSNPLNVHKLTANHPELLKTWWDLRNFYVTVGDLGKLKGELVNLLINFHMKAWYDWGSQIERRFNFRL